MVTMRVLSSRLSFFVFLACALPGFAPAADNWVEVRSPHFTVSSNAGEKQARRIANQFEEIRVIFHTEFATLRVDPGKPLLVIAVVSAGTGLLASGLFLRSELGESLRSPGAGYYLIVLAGLAASLGAIAATLPLLDGRKAQEMLEKGGIVGKIVLSRKAD